MPLISTNPVYGMDNMVDSIVVTYGDYVQKAHNKVIMNSDNPYTRIQYGFDPIQEVDENGNVTIKSMPFMFNLILQFIEDKKVESQNLIQFAGNTNDEEVSSVYISLINWGIETGPTKMTDIVTKKKQLLDCGNGVGVFMEMSIFGTPGSGSFTIDVYIYSKIVDEKLLEKTLNDTDEEENNLDADREFLETEVERELEESNSKVRNFSDYFRSRDEDALYNEDDYPDDDDDYLNL